MATVFVELTFIEVAIRVDDLATPLALTILQNTGEDIAIGMGEGALTVDLAIFPSALIGHPIGHRQNPSPRTLARLNRALVDCPI